MYMGTGNTNTGTREKFSAAAAEQNHHHLHIALFSEPEHYCTDTMMKPPRKPTHTERRTAEERWHVSRAAEKSKKAESERE